MIEVCLTIWGIVVLARQRIQLTREKIVRGRPAIVVGLILAGTFPITLSVFYVLGFTMYVFGADPRGLQPYSLFIENGVYVSIVITALAIASTYGKSPEELEAIKSRDELDAMKFVLPATDESNPYAPPGC